GIEARPRLLRPHRMRGGSLLVDDLLQSEFLAAKEHGRNFPLRLSCRFPSHSFTSLRRDTRLRPRSHFPERYAHSRPHAAALPEKQVGGDHAAAVAAA